MSLSRLVATCALVVAFVIETPAIGQIYVSPCGNDGFLGITPACDHPDPLARPKRSIQAAIAVAPDPGVVYVAAGAYPGGIDFGGKSVQVIAWHGTGSAIIVGGSPSVQFVSGEDENARLVGFQISGGDGGEGGGIRIVDSSPTILNCVITACTAGLGGGIYVESGAPRIESCNFIANSATFLGGGLHSVSRDTIVIDCTFSTNTAGTGGGGASGSGDFYGCSFLGNTSDDFGGGAHFIDNSYLVSCLFRGNISVANGGGLYLSGSGIGLGHALINCTVVDNTAELFEGGGVSSVASDVYVANSILDGNTDAAGGGSGTAQIHVSAGTTVVSWSCIRGGWTGPGAGALDADPVFDADHRLSVGSPCIDAGSTFSLPPDEPDLDGDGDTFEKVPIDLDGNPRLVDAVSYPDTGLGSPPVDMGAYEAPADLHAPTTYYVDPCGDDVWTGQSPLCMAPSGPKRTIQAGIDVAVDSDTVLVMPGTYPEQIDLGGKAITVLALGDAGETVVAGDGSGSVVTCNGDEGPDTRLIGLTITGGSAEFGGGMVIGGSSPSVVDCIFEGNVASDHGGMFPNGGAVSVSGFGASPLFAGCTFADNIAEGHDDGRGGAVFVSSITAPVFFACRFERNDAEAISHVGAGGAVYSSNAAPELICCTFVGNRAFGEIGGFGGAIYTVEGQAVITNCTFVANEVFFLGASGSGTGAGLYSDFAATTVANSVFWANTIDGVAVAQIESVGPPDCTVDFSCVQGGWTGPGGTGIVDTHPRFVDQLGPDGVPGSGDEDLRLGAGSPCIDSGDNTAVPVDGLDLDADGDTSERTSEDVAGNARFVDAVNYDDTGQGDGVNPLVDMGAYEAAADTPALLPGDATGDGEVDVDDLVEVITSWGDCPPAGPCPADFNNDGEVDVDDLVTVIVNWG